MFNPLELLLKEVWTVVLSKLSMEEKLSCRCVCVSFKKEVDSILKTNQDRLWLRQRDDDFTHYFCYDKDHRISSRDTLYFYRIICMKNLKLVSASMPSLKILQLDPFDPPYQKYYDYDDDYNDIDLPDYRDTEDKAVPITKIFPQVTCLILPGETETDNFVGDLSQVKHLTLLNGDLKESLTFPNLESLEVKRYLDDYGERLPMPSKRFVAPQGLIKWSSLPKTLEVIQTTLKCNNYVSVGQPYFSDLKIVEDLYTDGYADEKNLETVISFLKDHKESLTELSFSAEEEVANIKVLLPLLTNLHKLSVQIKTDKQAIEWKEVKALAHNLQYFELSFAFFGILKKTWVQFSKTFLWV